MIEHSAPVAFDFANLEGKTLRWNEISSAFDKCLYV